MYRYKVIFMKDNGGIGAFFRPSIFFGPIKAHEADAPEKELGGIFFQDIKFNRSEKNSVSPQKSGLELRGPLLGGS